jgi:murein DD-endopeptidase MepM/ murein hydrolase activator NlpD
MSNCEIEPVRYFLPRHSLFDIRYSRFTFAARFDSKSRKNISKTQNFNITCTDTQRMATDKNTSNRFAALKTRLAQTFERLKHISARDIVQSIESGWQRFKNLIEKARETFYQIKILNNETFAEVATYRLSVFNFYVFISSLFVGFTALGMMLIAFTPLRKIVPGYGGYGSERSVFELYERVDSIERAMRAHETYAKNVSRALTDDVEREKDVPKSSGNTPSLSKDSFSVEPSSEEMKIRAGGGSGDEDFDPTATATTNNSTQTTSTTTNSTPAATENKAIRVGSRNDRLESMFLQTPISGSINFGFSLDKKHYGVDIAAPKNTPIKSVADGFIIAADWTLETGNTIAVQHLNNVVSFYKHNSSNLKKVGDKVKTGEAIAIIGNTGEHTTGPHLHFELWKDGKAVNPVEYIRF